MGTLYLSPFRLHPYFEQYLASLHLALQPHEVQLTLMNVGCVSKADTAFWHFFVCNYVHNIVSVNSDVIAQILTIISAAIHPTKGNYIIDLCNLSFEAKNSVVNHQIIKELDDLAIDNKILKFGHCRNVLDCSAMIYVIENIVQEHEVEINFQDCSLTPEYINSLAIALGANSSTVQVRGLNLSNNKLNNSVGVDFFSRAVAAFESLRILILCNCEIGTRFDIKAILAGLTESCCQTLTHLDLSYNPISTPFLETLLCHIQSNATFDGLLTFSLKGSLKNNISTKILSNLSDTLRHRCKYLRRLDLSDNKLGEPGNPDLRKMISQLLSLGRDFHLCLNEEYMSEVNDEFICVMEETIKRKGTINHTIAHGVIVGPGRSGKNTLMSRLMGNGPPDPSSRSPSTGVLENIVKVEVKKLCTVATAVSNLEWKKMKYDEEALELIMTTARHHLATTRISKPVAYKYILQSPITGAKNVQPLLPHKTLAKRKQRRKYKFLELFKKLKEVEEIKNPLLRMKKI